MNNNKPYDLKERTFLFAKEVFLFMKSIRDTRLNSVLSVQLIRSATSVGANFEEASESFTKKDFRYKASIAKKEAKESNYWLRLLMDTGCVHSDDMSMCHALIQESKELVKILDCMLRRWGRLFFFWYLKFGIFLDRG